MNKLGPAGYMLANVLNKRTIADNLQVAQREYDGKWVVWQYNFVVEEDCSFSEFWEAIGVFAYKDQAVEFMKQWPVSRKVA